MKQQKLVKEDEKLTEEMQAKICVKYLDAKLVIKEQTYNKRK